MIKIIKFQPQNLNGINLGELGNRVEECALHACAASNQHLISSNFCLNFIYFGISTLLARTWYVQIWWQKALLIVWGGSEGGELLLRQRSWPPWHSGCYVRWERVISFQHILYLRYVLTSLGCISFKTCVSMYLSFKLIPFKQKSAKRN